MPRVLPTHLIVVERHVRRIGHLDARRCLPRAGLLITNGRRSADKVCKAKLEVCEPGEHKPCGYR